MSQEKILIVEDEDAILMLLEDDLTMEGYAVTTARDGERGLSMARDDEYDLVILDIMLPKKDGFEVCSELRGSGVDARRSDRSRELVSYLRRVVCTP